jgi:hypothetical protein
MNELVVTLSAAARHNVATALERSANDAVMDDTAAGVVQALSSAVMREGRRSGLSLDSLDGLQVWLGDQDYPRQIDLTEFTRFEPLQVDSHDNMAVQSRQFGLWKGKLMIVEDDDEHLDLFEDYMP